MLKCLLSVCAILFSSLGHLSAMPAQVILIRHAEKPPQGPELSLKGKERAAALVPYFLNTPDLIKFGTPVAIYAAAAPKETSSKRSIETVRGLAEFLKVPIHDRYQVDDFKAMVEEVKTNPAYVGKLVLICWEHHIIPEIARALGAFQTTARWRGEVFDRTWVITFPVSGRPAYQDLPQRLLFGDSAT